MTVDFHADDRRDLNTLGVDESAERLQQIIETSLLILNGIETEEFVYGDLRIERSDSGALVIFRRALAGGQEREILLRAKPAESEPETYEVNVYHNGAWLDLMAAIKEALNRGLSPDRLSDLRSRFNPCAKRDKSHRYEDDMLWALIQSITSKV